MRTPGGGDEIHGNFSVIPGNQLTVTELRSYEPGVARVDDPLATPVAAYYHADLIGSTWSMSDENGEGVDAARYSAFGELVEGTAHRYGYAGAYGYQTDADVYGGPGAFPFLHVGARYYDPATGRFLQRDPIGILGGLNVYAYVRNRPMSYLDPNGLDFTGALEDAAVGAVVGGTYCGTCLGVTGGMAGGGPGAVAGGLAGGAVGSISGWCGGFVSHYIADWLFDRHPTPPPPIPTPPPMEPLPPLVGPPDPGWAA